MFDFKLVSTMCHKKCLSKPLIIFVAFACLIAPLTGLGGQVLTDAGKLERVYALYADYKEAFPLVKDISAKDAMQMMKNGKNLVFVDTRRPEEMAISMLPNAISKEVFLAGSPAAYADSVVIAYCTISYRSGIFARDLAGAGRELYNLKGGLLAWVLEGGVVYDRDGVSRRVHVYGDKWKLAPDGYEMIVFPLWKQFFPFT